jgi:ABC-type nitrate/sulfonate/bicarbonate transport system substrate-binding protein
VSGVWIAAADWAKANPGAVKAFREAIAEAAAMIQKEPELGREKQKKYLHFVVAKGSVPATSVTVKDLQFWIDLMKPLGLIPQPLNLPDLILP